MCADIKVSVLGRPSIIKDNERITFPYRQAEAILYYLLENRVADKEVLADIIWEDKYTAEKIHSNLRNAFYIIRKTMGKDFLIKEGSCGIGINPSYSVFLDSEQFLKDNSALSDYQGDFLEGFYLKNNNLFNDWVVSTRQMYKSMYLKKLQHSIISQFELKNYEQCEALCMQQITINEFDETAYKFLMQIYLNRKDYTQALHIYNQLEQLLAEELFGTPGKELQELALSIEKNWNQEVCHILEGKKELMVSLKKDSIFCGRESELEQLKEDFLQLDLSQISHHILISGEAGIGKTKLIEHALEEKFCSSDYLLLETQCYFAEEKYILKPWQKPVRRLMKYLEEHKNSGENSTLIQSIWSLFPFTREHYKISLDADDISTYDYKSIQSIFINACIRFSMEKPLIFYFDDLQWADSITLSLLKDFITSLSAYHAQHVLFLFTLRDNCDTEIKSFINSLTSQNLLKNYALKRFSREETIQLAQTLFPAYPYTPEIQKQLFQATDGNALFITEAVNNLLYNGSPHDLTPNMRNIIKQRIDPIPYEHRKILDLISLFFDGISFKCLSTLSHKEDFELVEILEYLLNQHLLKEAFDHDNTFFSFTHQKIMEYVYDEMSWTKKRILHNTAGYYYESLLQNNTMDMAYYPKLIYHFERSANHEKYLKYSVKYLYNYLNVTHEFFPVIDQNLTLFNLDMHKETKDLLSHDLTAIEKLLSSIENTVAASSGDFFAQQISEQETLEIWSDFLHMIGRHYIRICNYERGLAYIQKLREINLPPKTSFCRDKLLQANRQLICVYINRYEPQKMKETIEDSLLLLENTNLTDEIAIWKRLRGLFHIMEGSLENGIQDLQEAIQIFTTSPEREKHLYNLAATYSWIGEAYRHRENYPRALSNYEKAISICSKNFLVSGIAIFYAYAGMASVDSGNYDLAESYLENSIFHYDKGNLMWGRSLAYSYMGVLLLKKGKLHAALQHLETAFTYAAKLDSRYETGIIYRIYSQIKAGYFDDSCPEAKTVKALPETYSFYAQKAFTLLEGVYSPVDFKYLKEQ